jgi:hypothetical protein
VHHVGVFTCCALNKKNNKGDNETIILKVRIIHKIKLGFLKMRRGGMI